jgi:hypothetical protein
MCENRSNIIKKFLALDIPWCNLMGYKNPYVDDFDHFITKNIPDFDGQAYRRYPKYKFVYDKLWVAKSQGLMCGTLDSLENNKNLEFPIFIKPRWGHLTSTSRGCFKIKSYEELEKYRNYEDMMWSEFIDAKEQMTDYIMLNGNIMHQITYEYSESQNGFIDEWKYISPKNKPFPKITAWVNDHMNGFTGIVNVQYRSDKIIEVGMRFARGGAYILSTQNKYLIENINNVADSNTWNHSFNDKMDFEPFYSFKCYCSMFPIYLLPQKLIDNMMTSNNAMPFYEYYFEPSGKNGTVVFQFMHVDYEAGMKLKKKFEQYINMFQYIFLVSFFIACFLLAYNKNLAILIFIIIGLLYSTKFLNPLTTHYNHFKVFKQMFIA